MPVHNPYKNVDWSNEHIASVSHAHFRAQSQFDNAYGEGIRHFAISNYHPSNLTYPLLDHFPSLPEDAIGSPNTEHYNMNGTSLHFNSVGSFYESGDGVRDTWKHAFNKTFEELQFSDGGGITINHPVWTGLSTSFILDMLDYDERVLGIEVWTDSAGSRADSRNLWDRILSTGRRCFGFSVPDHSGKTKPWKGRNILLPSETTEQGCLLAYRKGHFYMSDEGRTSYLHFTNIIANSRSVEVSTNAGTTIEMVTNLGRILHTGSQHTFGLSGRETYVRFEVVRGSERIYSQPIMYKTKDEIAKNEIKKKFIILN